MKRNLQKAFIILTILFGFFLVPTKTLALQGDAPDGSTSDSSEVDISGLNADAETLDSLNPLKILNGDTSLNTPGAIISKAMNTFIFPIAGIILFLMLVFGGFQMLLGATNSNAIEEGKKRVTTAAVGFIILFASYWIIQLVEMIFGINILGN